MSTTLLRQQKYQVRSVLLSLRSAWSTRTAIPLSASRYGTPQAKKGLGASANFIIEERMPGFCATTLRTSRASRKWETGVYSARLSHTDQKRLIELRKNMPSDIIYHVV